jgi:hypothetical protein
VKNRVTNPPKREIESVNSISLQLVISFFFCKTIFRKVAISYGPVQNYCERGAASRKRKGIIGVVVCEGGTGMTWSCTSDLCQVMVSISRVLWMMLRILTKSSTPLSKDNVLQKSITPLPLTLWLGETVSRCIQIYYNGPHCVLQVANKTEKLFARRCVLGFTFLFFASFTFFVSAHIIRENCYV